MNRFRASQSVQLQTLQRVPEQNVLLQMLNMARTSPDRLVSQAFTCEQRRALYTLTTTCSDANAPLMNKRGHSNEPLWALTRQIDGQHDRIFAHASGDVQLIANMIWSEVMGTSIQGASGAATTTVGEHPALNKAAEGQKQPKSINRRTMSRTFSMCRDKRWLSPWPETFAK